MAKKLKITEDQLKRLIAKQKMISEQPETGGEVNFDVTNDSQLTTKNMNEHEGEEKHYMFFNSLEEIKRKAELLLNKIDHEMMDKLLDEHDWAAAHITTAENDLSQVFDFFMNKAKGDHVDDEEENSHDEGLDREDKEDKEDKEEDTMNKNIKGDEHDDKEEDDDKEEEDDKEEMNESIKKIKANFQRFL